MGTVSSMSKDRTLKVSESMDESTEFDFKINLLKNNRNTTNSFQQSETAEKTKMSELCVRKILKLSRKSCGKTAKKS